MIRIANIGERMIRPIADSTMSINLLIFKYISRASFMLDSWSVFGWLGKPKDQTNLLINPFNIFPVSSANFKTSLYDTSSIYFKSFASNN